MTTGFTDTHQYLSTADQLTGRVGITHFAQEQLGDVVFVEMPAIGLRLEVGDLVGAIESVKTASEFFSPVSGVVTAVNPAVVADTSLVNSAPQAAGWLFEISISHPAELNNLMSEADYLKQVGA
jgi:glycine cleavage system H protein